MNWNIRLFQKINALVGQNKRLDAFGRAGAEWVIIAMAGWFVATDIIAVMPKYRAAMLPLVFLAGALIVGWLLNILIGVIVKEPRPHVTDVQRKLLFKPLMSWKSFPSDHAMGAFTIFFIALVFNLPYAWALFPLALWVGWGRVFSGVHYPFDIVGGITVAALVSMIVYYVTVLLF